MTGKAGVVAPPNNTVKPQPGSLHNKSAAIARAAATKAAAAKLAASATKAAAQQQRALARKAMAAKNNTNKSRLSEDDDEFGDSIETAEGAMAAMAAATAKKAGMRRGGGGGFSSGAAMTLAAALGGGGGASAGLLNAMAMSGSSASNAASLSSLRKRIGADATRGKAGLGANGCSRITAAQQAAFARRGGVQSLGGVGVGGGGLMSSTGSLSGMGSHSSRASSTTSGAVTNNHSSAAAKAKAKTTGSGGGGAGASSSNVDLDIQQIPGAKQIDGVQPNGYTVSERGVVRPVVTFTQRPKVAHNFRQTGLDKVFSVWQHERKVSDAMALQKSLLTEQEIYARAEGMVEYRAALMAKLKEIRGGGG